MYVSGPPPQRSHHESKNYFCEQSSSTASSSRRQTTLPISKPFSYRRVIVPDSVKTRAFRVATETVKGVYEFSWQTAAYIRLASQSMVDDAQRAVDDALSSRSWRRK